MRLQPLGHPSAACAGTQADVLAGLGAPQRGADPTKRAQGINHQDRLAKLQNAPRSLAFAFSIARLDAGPRGTRREAGRFGCMIPAGEGSS